MTGEKYRLASDVVSVFGTVYGTAGTEITVVSVSGNVAIAEDGNGDRFPVLIELLTKDEVEKKAQVNLIVIEQPVIKNHSAHRKHKTAAPSTQQNLF